MVRSTQFYYESSPTASNKPWVPEEEFEIVNADAGCMTCFGYAPSKGRRCQKIVNNSSRKCIREIFSKIESLRPDNSAVVPQLRSILGLGLCYLHRDQVEKIMAQWQAHLQELASRIRKPTPVNPTGPAQTYSEKEIKLEDKIEGLLEQIRQMQNMLKKVQEEKIEQQQGSKKREEPTVKKEEEEDEQLETERLEKERKEREEKERKAREANERKEREENQRKEREEKERKDREEKEQRERENAARNERIRQRAQKRREDEEREKQEREKKEREEWDSLWSEYQERWKLFKSSAPNEKSAQEAVPWPVKSFSSRDVNYSNVNEFLREATPRGVNLSSLLRKECMKWHPDRKMIPGLLGGIQLPEVDQMMVNMICRAVTELLDSI